VLPPRGQATFQLGKEAADTKLLNRKMARTMQILRIMVDESKEQHVLVIVMKQSGDFEILILAAHR
jgi:hypothetical protein